MYDSQGLVSQGHGAYYDTPAAGTTLLAAATRSRLQTVNEYDGAGRRTAVVQRSLGIEKWRTITAYDGDRTDVTPPSGGDRATTYTDARGNTTNCASTTADPRPGPSTRPTTRTRPAGDTASITDPAGNSWTYAYDVLGRQVAAGDPDRAGPR